MIVIIQLLKIKSQSSKGKTLFLIFVLLISIIPSTVIPIQIGQAGDSNRSISSTNDTRVNDDSGSSAQTKPSITAFSNHVYAVWNDKRNGDMDIYFSHSGDGGLTWGDGIKNTDTRINTDLTITDQQNPDIAVDSQGVIFTVWEDFRYDNWDVFISYSMDNGASWSMNMAVNSTDPWPDNQRDPKIAINSNDQIYIVFKNDVAGSDMLQIIRSDDGGKSFGEPVNISKGTLTTDQVDADICTGPNNNVYIAWSQAADEFNSNIYFSYFKGDDLNISKPVLVDNESQGIQKSRPSIYIGPSGDIFISWLENNNNRYNILFDKSFDNGSSFFQDIRVNMVKNTVHAGAKPDLIVSSSGIIYVAWVDTLNDYHIQVSLSTDGGITFKNGTIVDKTRASNSEAARSLESQLERLNPIIILDPDKKNLYAVWEDYRNDPLPGNGIPENGDIFFSWISGLSNVEPSQIYLSLNTLSWDVVQIDWSMSHEPDFAFYTLEVSRTTEFNSNTVFRSVVITERLSNTFQITDLNASTTYYFRLRVNDTGGKSFVTPVIAGKTLNNVPPAITLIEPDGISDYANLAYTIKWQDNDPDDNATITLFFNNDILGEKLIAEVPEGEDGTIDSFVWNTSGLVEGDYYIKIKIDDSHNTPVYRISDYWVTIDHNIDITPPEIIEFFPAELETDVLVNSMISVKFNEPLSDVTSLERAITLYTKSRGVVDGSVVYDPVNFSINFIPDEKLELLMWYNVTLHSGISDLYGNINTSSITWRFQTAAIDVIFVTPADGATNVSLDRKILLVFSESMNTTTVEQSMILDPPSKGLLFNWSLNDSKLTISHNEFEADWQYEFSIGPRLESRSGKILSKKLSITFSTTSMEYPPELLDFGYFKIKDKYLFYTEYLDKNNDPPKSSLLYIYKDNEFYQKIEMQVITDLIVEKLDVFYVVDEQSFDGSYKNGEIFYSEISLLPGSYRYYFDFEDNDSKANSENVPLTFEDSAVGPTVPDEEEFSINDVSIFVIMTVIIIIIVVLILIVFNFNKKANHVRDERTGEDRDDADSE